jgi:hypothetical protein
MKTQLKVLMVVSIIVFAIISTFKIVNAFYIPLPGICNILDNIKGNGNVIAKERTIDNFNEISVCSGIDLYIKKDASQKLEVVADENLHDIIITEVKNGVLNIYLKKSVQKSKSLRVNVSFTELKKLKASGGSDVYSEGPIQLQDLTIELSGGCDLQMECQLTNFICSLSGGCDATLKGTADNCTFTNHGGSDIKAENLLISKCTITSSGGSDANLNVKDELSADASGGSDIDYTGDPKILKISTSGASDINKK